MSSRLSLVMLLCAITVGIVGMHGLVPGAGSAEHVGHAISHPVEALRGGEVSEGDRVSDATPPVDDAGILAMCLMVLTPGLALGVWLVATTRTRGWGHRPLLARVVAAADLAALPPPSARQRTILRI